MPDEFGPQIEADAYRVYLYLSAFPDHGVVRCILRVGDDASVSFAKQWLHEEQPKPLIADNLFDAWRVEKFREDHTYEVIAQGLAERECQWKGDRRKRLRDFHEERAGASDLRNGIGTLYPEASKGRSTRGSGLAKRRPGRKQRPPRALTPFQEKMQALKDEAKRKIGEKPREPISDTRRQWQRLIADNRSRSMDVRGG